MSVVVVVTAFPIPEHRAEVVAAFEEAIARVHDEPGVELYALHEGRDRLVMICVPSRVQSSSAAAGSRRGFLRKRVPAPPRPRSGRLCRPR